ncbi:RNA polymerase sigma factor [Siphonobacter sp.]|uniref:RNA polymerase sigma factor n=1 Tax=Siphonobacter sp. TaxID=1869184 RepID=UPI003B3A7C8D
MPPINPLPDSSERKEEKRIEALRVNDADAWRDFYLEVSRIFIPYALQRSSISEDDAYDVFQEAMIECSLKIKDGRFQFQGKPITAYAFTICRYRWINFVKRQKPTDSYQEWSLEEDNPFLDDETESTPSSVQDWADPSNLWGDETVEADLTALQRAKDELSDACRTLIECFYVEEKSLAECGARLGIQEGSAKVKRFRCTQRFRELYLTYRKKE